MSELYWIGRVGAMDSALVVIIIILAIVGLGGLLFSFAMIDELETDSIIKLRRFTKASLIAFVLLLFIEVFIPSTKEMYIIYGIGGTIDYIKQDSVGNQLPHKVIEACDKFLEQELKEDNEE